MSKEIKSVIQQGMDTHSWTLSTLYAEEAGGSVHSQVLLCLKLARAIWSHVQKDLKKKSCLPSKTKMNSENDDFTAEFYQTLLKISTSPYQLFPKNSGHKNTSKIIF